MSTRNRIRRALESGADPLCAHALEREGMPPLSLLTDLGLVKPIRTRVPKCSEHGCPHRGACDYEELFETGGAGRAGRKARVLKDAGAIARCPARLRLRILEMPLCRFLLQALASGPRSIFALNTALVRQCLEEIETHGEVKATAFERASLGWALALLEEQGLIRRSEDGAAVLLVEEGVSE